MPDIDPQYWGGKKVLLGGGCGFLGSYLLPLLVEAGCGVTVVDDLSNGTTTYLEPFRDHVQVVEADLGRPEVAASATKGKDIMMNLAARAFGMEYSRFHDGEMLTSNLTCTLVPLEAARINGVRQVLVMSSSCVYPDHAQVPTPELPVFTNSPESVNEGYGWAKRIQELAGYYYARDHGMKVTTVRPFNPYGANYRWGSEEKAHVIPALVKRVLDGEDPVIVWGSGNQERNFLHASDAAYLLMLLMERNHSAEPINVGYEETSTIRDLTELICEVAGVSPELVFDNSKPEGRFKKSADSTRLRSLTGDFSPRVSLREGIQEMLEWYERSFRKTSV